MAFLVVHGNLIKAIRNPDLVAGEGRPTRSAALRSLLEASEDRIRDMLLKSHGKDTAKEVDGSDERTSSRQTVGQILHDEKRRESKDVAAPMTETASDKCRVDYSIRPKEKSFMPWRKSARSESRYTSVD